MIRNSAALSAILDYYYAQSGFEIMLMLGGAAITPAYLLADFLALEVTATGYARQSISFGSSAVDEATQSVKFAEQTVTFSAPTQAITYDSIACIRASTEVIYPIDIRPESGGGTQYTIQVGQTHDVKVNLGLKIG